ncbi:MAG: hypothetical protein FJX72_14710 [Armatimonadetes bacterium]|nr:hypothetical protein [Armatimonadota bacterium]
MSAPGASPLARSMRHGWMVLAALGAIVALSACPKDGEKPGWFGGWEIELVAPSHWEFGSVDVPPASQASPGWQKCGNAYWWHRERRFGPIRAIYDGP